ncbi:MAG TPA: hypothetical protein VL357_09010 [Rariglobus sp.]|jgi:hypothetical protein|nr:hypothetical protein [Rariglobus sp.]
MANRTPKDILHRVMKIARLNGRSIVIVAGICALISLAGGDIVGGVIGLIVAAGGAVELRGCRKLQQHDADEGITLLIRAQWIVMGAICAYALGKLFSYDAQTAMGNMTGDMKTIIDQFGLSSADINRILTPVFYAIYVTVLVVTVIYQGGMVIYYRNRREAVREALTAVPVIPALHRPRPTVGEDVMDN